MKESNITKEVIRLSKEIAEYWRMEIYVGCWLTKGGEVYHVGYIEKQKDGSMAFDLSTANGLDDIACYRQDIKKYFPIPSISDCLEKLREKYMDVSEDSEDEIKDSLVGIFYKRTTPSAFHEALLSALLEVLKNSVT